MTRTLAAIDVEATREVQRRAVAAAITAALEEPKGSKPTPEAWLAGPYAETMTHLKNYAAGQDAEAHGSAVYALLDSGTVLTADGAAQLLKSVGFWPEHLPVSWVRSLDSSLELQQGE